MINNNLISVIIPMYNNSAEIIKTLDTVYNQTVLPYEIVVCDDGSSDNSVSLVKNYFENNKDIIANTKIIMQNNQGAGAARNNAIKNTSGKWIAFLDSDDLWMPNKLEKVCAIIKKYEDINIISHNEYSIYGENNKNKALNDYSNWYNTKQDLFVQLFEQNFFSTSCMVVKKKLIENAGFFDEGLRSAQDYDLWLRLSDKQKAYIIDEPLAYYVVRSGNISSNTYRRYVCEMHIIDKYKHQVFQLLGKNKGKKLIKSKILKIHLIEGHAAIRNKQFGAAIKITVRMIPSLVRK